jgi:hypothetical protein
LNLRFPSVNVSKVASFLYLNRLYGSRPSLPYQHIYYSIKTQFCLKKYIFLYVFFV